jgi:hypothetical protein
VKKVGSDTPAVVTTRHSWSIQLPGRVAAITPSGSATAQASAGPAAPARATPAAAASSSCSTGCPVVSEVPKSPRSQAPT